MVDILDWREEWYDKIVSQTFVLRSINQAAARPWSGAGMAIGNRPHTQMWVTNVTMMPLYDPILQDMDAFFTDLKGRSGVMRMSNAMRLTPWFDRHATATKSPFSDGSMFTDGSGFSSGYLPPEVFVQTAALKGANYIVLGGFPASTTNVLRAGDFLQIKPNGIAGSGPHLYKAMFGGNSDASGQIGFRIEPRLRQSVAAGDVVSLRNPSTVFRLADDNQADIEGSAAGIGNFGFSLIEALDLVP